MWYEIIPSFAIITAALTFPTVFNYFFYKFFHNGNPYNRNLLPYFNRDLYLRDMRLNGNPYLMEGLDKIPDPPKEK